MTQCYLCEKGELQNKKVPYHLYGELVGNFNAEVCIACREIFFAEETSKRITAATKAKGLWGIGGKTTIGQSGNTLDVRLPKRLIDFLGIKKGEEVNIYAEDKHKIIIEI